MRFAARMTASVALLLCLTLSAGGAWTVRQNFLHALDSAAQQYAAQQLRERFTLETQLLQVSGKQTGDLLNALEAYARSLRAAGGSGTPFSVRDDAGTTFYSTMPSAITYADQQRAAAAGETGMCCAAAGGRRFLLLGAPLAGYRRTLWFVSAYDVTALFAERDRQLRSWFVLECVALTAAGAAAAAMSAFLTGPLRGLEKASRSVAAGHYGVRCAVDTGDELGALGESFNTMAGAVEAHVAALHEETERQKRFVAAFTHELKTPMTAILGYADLLRGAQQPPERSQRAANHIYHEAARLEQLGGALLTLLGLERGGVCPVPTSLSAVLAEVCRSLPALPVRLEAACPPDAAVLADRALLVTLVRNLVLNAAASDPRDGAVTVCCERADGGWQIAVRDTGRGIPPEALEKVFEPFYRVDKGRARQNGGSGLGLALCREIAQAHGGRLWLKSAPGQGTAAFVWLKEAGE